jgi:hypothetical protein
VSERAFRSVTSLAGDSAIMSWVGLSGDAFREQFGNFPDQLRKLYTSHEMAGDALVAYAPQLTSAQAQADKALADGREARAQLTTVTGALNAASNAATSAANLAEQTKNPGNGAPAPDPDQVAQAVRNAQTAASEQSSAQGAVDSAQAVLDAAKSLAEQARQMRATAASACAHKIDEASDAGIPPRSFWQKLGDFFKQLWDIICEVAKWVALVAGIIAMIIGGPLAWIALAAGAILLIKAVVDFAQGKGSVMDLVFGILGVIPGVKGLTTLGRLKELYRAGGLKAIGAAALANAKSFLPALANVIKNGNAGTFIQKIFINPFRHGDELPPITRGVPDEHTPLLDPPNIPAGAADDLPPVNVGDDIPPANTGDHIPPADTRPPTPDPVVPVPEFGMPTQLKPDPLKPNVFVDAKFPDAEFTLSKVDPDGFDPPVFKVGGTDELVYFDVDTLKYMKYDPEAGSANYFDGLTGNPADVGVVTFPKSDLNFTVRGFETMDLPKIDTFTDLSKLPISDTPVLVKTSELDSISVRGDFDRARVDSIKEAYEKGIPLPPMGMSKGDLTINDGNHRLIAARELGLEYIPVTVGI